MHKIACIIVLATALFAAPALQKETEFRQGDGSTFKGHLKGDEWFNWVQTGEGYVAKYNPGSKNYEYMILGTENNRSGLKFSHIKVTAPADGAPPQTPPAQIKKISPKELGKIWKEKRKSKHPQ